MVGNSFQMIGAATEKARLPRFSFVLGIESCWEVSMNITTPDKYNGEPLLRTFQLMMDRMGNSYGKYNWKQLVGPLLHDRHNSDCYCQ